MALIGLQDVTFSYGGPPLLVDINLQVEPAERLCLLGRNGAGKSTLLKLIENTLAPDTGSIIHRQNIVISSVPQQVPQQLDGAVFALIADGLGPKGKIIAEYHNLTHQLTTNSSPALLKRLDQIQHQLDIDSGWDTHRQVETIISKMNLDPDARVADMSAGLKRRTLLSRSLAAQPDVLLLDEPTNHLDIAAIDWLEEFLLNFNRTLIFVTHDRAFLKKIATRIIDLDRTKLTSFPCDYQTYLDRKQQALDNETRHNELFDKKLTVEEAWLRKGVKHRRARNEGRVRALMEMRQQRRWRLEQLGHVKMQTQSAPRSGRIVIKADHLNFAYQPGKLIVKDFSTIIERGDKIAFIGTNGSGKTTLMRLLLDQLTPQSGSVTHGANLQIAYFDQLHAELDEQKTAAENVCPGSQTVFINGKPRHILGYLQDFLFTPALARTPVWRLSGGERNRLLLAKMFTQPANVLLLDEPTNDLDLETLELLEELLLDYNGTVLFISHDREFINNIATGTFVFEGDGFIKEYAGGYDDWIAQRKPKSATEPTPKKTTKTSRKKNKTAGIPRLTYAQQLELQKLPQKIEILEEQLAHLHQKLADPNLYKKPPDTINQLKSDAQNLESQLQSTYDRWEHLEQFKQ